MARARDDALPTGYRLDQAIVASRHVVFLLLHAGRDRSLELVAEPAGSHRAATDRGAVVYRHDGLMVTIYAFGPTGRPQQNYRALARQAGRHLVWGTTDLSRIVP